MLSRASATADDIDTASVITEVLTHWGQKSRDRTEGNEQEKIP